MTKYSTTIPNDVGTRVTTLEASQETQDDALEVISATLNGSVPTFLNFVPNPAPDRYVLFEDKGDGTIDISMMELAN